MLDPAEHDFWLRHHMVHGFLMPDLEETFTRDGVEISIEVNQIEAWYREAEQRTFAEELVKGYVDAWAFDHDTHLTVLFHATSEHQPDGTTRHTRQVRGTTSISDRVEVVVRHADGSEETSDSASFKNKDKLVSKARSNEVLRKALRYYNEEVADNDRPLYGIYKAQEQLEDAEGSRGALAALVGEGKKYVAKVMETTQSQRHSGTRARNLLTDAECRARAHMLIRAYAEGT